MRLLFIPEQIEPETNERTPKLRELLAENHTVIGIRDDVAGYVYNQKKTKVFRYVMYFVNSIYMLWLCLLKAREHHIDLVFCEGAHYALIGVFVSKILGKPCIWDSHGNLSMFCRQLGKSRAYTALSVALEETLGKHVDALITVSQTDRKAYEDMDIDPRKIYVVPTCVDYPMVCRTSQSREKTRRDLGLTSRDVMILFFGSLDYAPNSEAADYINQTLAPRLSQAFPDMRIFIAGRGECPSIPHEAVSYLGFVPNIYDLIRASDICIAPMWSGVGILTKVLDMMACGKPTVVTPLARDGIPELVHNQNVIFASDRKDFVRKTKDLLERRDLCSLLGRQAKEMILERYTWENARLDLESLLTEVTGTGRQAES